MLEQTSTEELIERDIAPCVLTVLDLMAIRTCDWTGTATELKDQIDCEENPSVLSKKLNEFKDFLLDRGVEYRLEAKHANRVIRLEKIKSRDGGDGRDT